MAVTSEKLDVHAQLDRAREALGDALGQTQDITSTGLDAGQVSASLAGAVKVIFSVQKNGLEDPGSEAGIQEAMGHLRTTLERLQDVPDNAQLQTITGTVARILALLYPVAKVFEMVGAAREQQVVPNGSDAPIMLTDAATEPAPPIIDAPISLVDGRRSQMPPPIATAPPSGEDRRTLGRRMLDVDIGIQSDTNFFTGFSLDISSGGIFIATFDILRIGERLNVNFTVPDGPVLSVDGVVRWVREYNETTPDVEPGMGVEFESLKPEDQRAINHFMESNPPIFFDND